MMRLEGAKQKDNVLAESGSTNHDNGRSGSPELAAVQLYNWRLQNSLLGADGLVPELR